jgi:hypothetical protein
VEEDPPLVPRTELTAVPYSAVSQRISGDVITGPAELIVSGPDPAIGITQAVDSGFGASILIAFDDEGLVGARCDRKVKILEAVEIDEFGDTTGTAALKVDSALGATMELAVDDENFAEIRCNKKVAKFEALQTDEFGDTTGWISQEIDNGVTSFGYMDMPISNVVNVCGYATLPGYGNNFAQMRLDQLTGDTNAIITQSVDTFGTTILLEVDGDDFASIRCDKKKTAFQAMQSNDLGDTTGMIALTVDTGSVSLVGEEGDDIYSTELDGTTITTRYTYDGLDRVITSVGTDNSMLVFFDPQSSDTAMVLEEASLSFATALDLAGFSADGIVYASGGDTTVSITPDGILDVIYLIKAGEVRINDAAGTRRALRYSTDGTRRFEAAINQTPETGSDAGSDYVITRFDDSGSPLGAALFIERATGEVGINTTTPSYTLDVQGTIGGSGGLYHGSDMRLKKRVRPIDGAVEKIDGLRGVRFEWRRDEFPAKNLPDGEHIGLIAQEVEAVVPEVVATDGDGYKSVEYGNLVALLVEAVKEQGQTIAGQDEKIDALEAQVKQLSDQVGALAATRSQPVGELVSNK